MTNRDIAWIVVLYGAAFVAVAYFTRAKSRRIGGALAGGAVFGVVALLAVALAEAQGLWQIPKTGSYFQLLLWVGLFISCAPVYLLTWRVARRFGGVGLAISVMAVVVIGPPRDYWIAATFPKWMTFSPGVAPVLADAMIYALLVIVGHGVMRVVAGSSQTDSFAR